MPASQGPTGPGAALALPAGWKQLSFFDDPPTVPAVVYVYAMLSGPALNTNACPDLRKSCPDGRLIALDTIPSEKGGIVDFGTASYARPLTIAEMEEFDMAPASENAYLYPIETRVLVHGRDEATVIGHLPRHGYQVRFDNTGDEGEVSYKALSVVSISTGETASIDVPAAPQPQPIYVYAMINRPAEDGTCPADGHLVDLDVYHLPSEADDTYGTVSYSRALSISEMYRYEMAPVSENAFPYAINARVLVNDIDEATVTGHLPRHRYMVRYDCTGTEDNVSYKVIAPLLPEPEPEPVIATTVELVNDDFPAEAYTALNGQPYAAGNGHLGDTEWCAWDTRSSSREGCKYKALRMSDGTAIESGVSAYTAHPDYGTCCVCQQTKHSFFSYTHRGELICMKCRQTQILDTADQVVQAIVQIRGNLIRQGHNLAEYKLVGVLQHKKYAERRMIELEHGDVIYNLDLHIDGSLTPGDNVNLFELDRDFYHLPEYDLVWDHFEADYWPEADRGNVYPHDTVVFDPEQAEPVCELCGEPGTTHPSGNILCATCSEKIAAYQARLEARIDRLQARAASANGTAEALAEQGHNMLDRIPGGQPIQAGHYSEAGDRRYRVRVQGTFARSLEAVRRAEELSRRATAAATNRAISSDDPATVLKLKTKLAELEALQEHMTAVNKVVRKLAKQPAWEDDPPGSSMQVRNEVHRQNMERLREAAKSWPALAPELARQANISEAEALKLLTPDFAGRIGYAAYALRNNNAEIRRLKDRIQSLTEQAERAREGTTEEAIGGIKIIQNVEMNRLQIEFPEKPRKEIISELRSHGFLWAPSQGDHGRWQRKPTAAAEHWAKVIVAHANQA